MMDHRTRLKQGLLRIAGSALLALFLLPGLTYALSSHILDTWDGGFAANVQQKLGKDQRAAADAFIAIAKPSALCHATQPELAKSRAEACAPFSSLWQVSTARDVSFGTLVGGAGLIVAAALFSLAAFGSRGIQYLSFVTGKRVMILGSAAGIFLQGAMLVWLSYWATAFFFKIYIVKLILIAALLVAAAVFAAIAGIFGSKQPVSRQVGELITPADAPRLWERIGQMASRLRTAPPKQIVAGIDANFYVTEAPIQVGADTLTGRTLYVSLPLLRKLEVGEADAVLAHELAHLSGGDTRNSAKLGPALLHYDQYCAAMREGGATIVAWPLLALYRMIFQMALARSSREREFRADAIAAGLVSPAAISHSLIKVAAYSAYRNKVESHLFEQRTQHSGALGIAAAIDSGLADYVRSQAFTDQIRSAHVPHPFDSHPPLSERMQAVGAVVAGGDFAEVAMAPAQSSWVNEIGTADAIERRLWSAYDAAFAAQHEQVLAVRYEPATEAERAVVLKHFPTETFGLKKGGAIEVSYEGIRSTLEPTIISWDGITGIKYRDGTFNDQLELSIDGPSGKATHKLQLPGIGKGKAGLQQAIGALWRRHQLMRHLQANAGGDAA